MRKHNPQNEVMKRNYLRWLENAHGRNVATVDQVAADLGRFEAQSGFKDFKTFNPEQAMSFKRVLAATKSSAGKTLAKATIYSTLRNLKAFFEWLSHQPGYRRRVQFADAAYFKPSDNDARIATARRERAAPSLDQVRHVIASMPGETVLERRDRAVVALTLLTAARDTAVTSLKLKHLDVAKRRLLQDAREVETKRRKSFVTGFYPVGDEVERIAVDWVEELASDHLFGPDDVLFPATKMNVGERGVLEPSGIDRRPWSNAGPIRRIFKEACAGAGLPYFNPHSLRKTIMRLAYDLNLGPRELKAWSQNMGHESVLTSLSSYGHLSDGEQLDVIAQIGVRAAEPVADEKAALGEIAAILARRRVR